MRYPVAVAGVILAVMAVGLAPAVLSKPAAQAPPAIQAVSAGPGALKAANSGLSHLNKPFHLSQAQKDAMFGSAPVALLPAVDHSMFMPPVANDYNIPGSCPSFVMAYYQTFQARLLRRTGAIPNPDIRISGSGIYSNGGGGFFFQSGEALETSGGNDTKGSGNYYALGYGPFFVNAVRFDKNNRIPGKFNNDVTMLKTWLAQGWGPDGDCFVLGFPVGQAWDQYVAPAADVYSGHPDSEAFVQFRGVCVVGYDDSKNAFRAFNCQGPGWGQNGFVWLSYDFVRDFAIEAWWMRLERGFLHDQQTMPVTPSGTRKIAENDEYLITYTGPGALVVTTTDGVKITGGTAKDALDIQRKRTFPFPVEAVPAVQTDASLTKFSTNVNVWDLFAVTGALANVTAKDSAVMFIAGNNVQKVNIACNANSSWRTLSPWNGSTVLSWRAPVAIVTSQSKNLNVTLSGVVLSYLYAPQAETVVSVASKKYKGRGTPDFVAVGAISAYIGSAFNRSIKVAGGPAYGTIDNPTSTTGKGLGKLQTRDQFFTSSLTFPDGSKTAAGAHTGGDISATIMAWGPVGPIAALGGNVYVSVLAHGPIASVLSTQQMDRGGSIYASLGAGLTPVPPAHASGVSAGLGAAGPGYSNIGVISADNYVLAATVAGLDPVNTGLGIYKPNFTGSVKKITTKRPYYGIPPAEGYQATPSINGDGCSANPISIPWPNAAFVQHTLAENAYFSWYCRAVAPIPTNDNFSAAQAISGGFGDLIGSNILATAETGEPAHHSAAMHSAWWTWTAPATGSVEFNAKGSNFDTTMAIYTGLAVNALALVGKNDDYYGVQSRVVFAATAGTTYRIAVDSYWDTDMGRINLNWLYQ